jgi:hypothetical protein
MTLTALEDHTSKVLLHWMTRRVADLPDEVKRLLPSDENTNIDSTILAKMDKTLQELFHDRIEQE